MSDLAATFSRIYAENLWNGDESLSGPGSSKTVTRNVVPAILQIVDRFKIQSVLNVGCGDDYWFPDLPCDYLGVDLVPQALERARGFHPKRAYQMTDEPWPEADLVVCRDVLQHLSAETGIDLLGRMSAVGRWFLLSTYLTGENGPDIEDGGFRSPDLSVAPYNLGPPLFLIYDGWSYDTGDHLRDPRKFLGLW